MSSPRRGGDEIFSPPAPGVPFPPMPQRGSLPGSQKRDAVTLDAVHRPMSMSAASASASHPTPGALGHRRPHRSDPPNMLNYIDSMGANNGPVRTSPDSPSVSHMSSHGSPLSEANEAALLQTARIRVSSRDQEAMKRLRTVMLDQSDSASAGTAASSTRSDSPSSPLFPSSTYALRDPGYQANGSARHARTASTLSQVLASASSQDPAPRSGGTDEPAAGPSTPSSLHRSRASSASGQPPPHATTASGRSSPRASIAAGSVPGAEYAVAVVGASAVGKSTFISKALRSWGQTRGPDIELDNGLTGE